MCETSFTQEYPMKARILHSMGDMHTGMEDFKEAVKYYTEAVSIRESMLPGDLSTASSYYNLGCAYFEMEKLLRSISNFGKALGIYKRQHPQDEQAIQRVQKAIDIAQKMRDSKK